MPLTPGTTLGPYEIQAPLGAGGMGEVYQARDTRLDRTVAIKVLPEHVAADPDLKQRFEREARTVAALNHPHICTLHDIGSQDGIDFLVMEYLDGETLAERLEKGALPLDQAFQIAIQIADALDKAHRQGIVHRDLKPGNIMLTKAGAKLLDFGLAKLRTIGPVGTDGYDATTHRSGPRTARGTLLGTLPYMAPEQVEGKDADSRSDIFAFGGVVYEMVTGARAFASDSQASLIAAIIGVDPPLMSSAQALSPPALDQLVEVCLSKDPDERWQSAGDLRRQLTWIVDSRSGLSAPATGVVAPQRGAWRPSASLAAAAVLVGSVLAGVAGWNLKPSPARPSGQFLLRTGADVANAVAISRDGTHIVYPSATGANMGLLVRRLGQLDATPLPGGDGGFAAFLSSDGEWVAFPDIRDGTLKKVPLSGGPPVAICDCRLWPTIRGASWSGDNSIVFGLEGSEGLWTVPAVGGDPERLTTVDTARELDHRWPDVLPNGKGVLFTAWSGSEETSRIALLSLETGQVTDVVAGGSASRYVASGHLVYSTGGGTLRARGFDEERLALTTDHPVPMLENVQVIFGGGANFSVSETGSLAYVRTAGSGNAFVWVDREGRDVPLGLDTQPHQTFQLSPDGTRVAVEIDGNAGNSDIHIYDVDGRTRSPLTFSAERECCPLWSPDGRQVVFTSSRDGARNLYSKAADGTGAVTRLTESPNAQVAYAWADAGRTLILVEDADLYAVSLDGGPTAQPLMRTNFREERPSVSPDGRWIAYESDESGQREVHVRPLPDVLEGHWVVSLGPDFRFRCGTVRLGQSSAP